MYLLIPHDEVKENFQLGDFVRLWFREVPNKFSNYSTHLWERRLRRVAPTINLIEPKPLFFIEFKAPE
jgi:hypothetical protein